MQLITINWYLSEKGLAIKVLVVWLVILDLIPRVFGQKRRNLALLGQPRLLDHGVWMSWTVSPLVWGNWRGTIISIPYGFCTQCLFNLVTIFHSSNVVYILFRRFLSFNIQHSSSYFYQFLKSLELIINQKYHFCIVISVCIYIFSLKFF